MTTSSIIRRSIDCPECGSRALMEQHHLSIPTWGPQTIEKNVGPPHVRCSNPECVLSAEQPA